MIEKPLNTAGTLFIVPTPIGNLDDLSPRSVKTLENVDLVASEDTRKTGILLSKLSLKKPLIRADEFKIMQASKTIIEHLNLGEDVAFVTDAGTPCISDPGNRLVAICRDQGYSVIPLPGPSAVSTALSVCGLKGESFLFLGFLAKKGKLRSKALEYFVNFPDPIVFFESAKRVEKTLYVLADLCPEKQIFMAREMSKTYEEYQLGSAASLLKTIKTRPGNLKGELTLILGSPAL
ncbi:MAG TPA: 16S rRNA (cytidine(1402)-2'-O)-methyltransferase [Oligoflexia bacterium]|nr:16S rRNA (cytidine(1402)-2'-O)-methyltransferase [Oligoflexia bacterium]HMR23889.1 16S rRNA (cytidine(1402)-2'-O)-methyltransferase [Oligoflexia bacterium]